MHQETRQSLIPQCSCDHAVLYPKKLLVTHMLCVGHTPATNDEKNRHRTMGQYSFPSMSSPPTKVKFKQHQEHSSSVPARVQKKMATTEEVQAGEYLDDVFLVMS